MNSLFTLISPYNDASYRSGTLTLSMGKTSSFPDVVLNKKLLKVFPKLMSRLYPQKNIGGKTRF